MSRCTRGLLFAQQRDRRPGVGSPTPSVVPSGLFSFQRQEGSPRDEDGNSPRPRGSTCHAAPLPKAPQAGPTAGCLRGQGARAGPPTQLATGPRWVSGNGSETQCDRMEILSTKWSSALYLWVLVAPLHRWMSAPHGDLGELSPHPHIAGLPLLSSESPSLAQGALWRGVQPSPLRSRSDPSQLLSPWLRICRPERPSWGLCGIFK